MFFLFCGEGATDLGTCIHPKTINTGENYLYGPLTIVVDQLVESKYSYSFLDSTNFGFVPRGMLAEYASKLRPKPKTIAFPGKNVNKETRYFYRNAQALAQIAVQYGLNTDNDVVAIL